MDGADLEHVRYKTPAELEADVRRRAKLIGARDEGLTTFGRQEDLARPNSVISSDIAARASPRHPLGTGDA